MRARRPLPVRIDRAGAATMVACLMVAACSQDAPTPSEAVHDPRTTPGLVGQRIVYCDDGSRADIDFLGDGLSMAVTWLPGRRSEVLRAGRTGDDYRGPGVRAVVAGRSIAFVRDGGGRPRVCHRVAEDARR